MNLFKKLFSRKRQSETVFNVMTTEEKALVAIDTNETVTEVENSYKVRSIKWRPFGKGGTIGTIGSEGGKIIWDFENADGARLTMEKDGDIAPYSVTLGIYGLMFHTHFCSTNNEANVFSNFAMDKIDEIFSMYEVQEIDRDDSWQEQHDKLVNQLAEQ